MSTRTSPATDKQLSYIADLVRQAFAGRILGPVNAKNADWMKVREMVRRTALELSTDAKEASAVIDALRGGLQNFGRWLGEATWKQLVTDAREKLVVLENYPQQREDGVWGLTVAAVDKDAPLPAAPDHFSAPTLIA